MTQLTLALSADRPATDPANDLFGQAPFASTLARAVRNYQGSDCIVMGLYGPWGSGKSTVLAFVEHELEQPKDSSSPVVVSFNPWWFSGQEHLARAFLGQLQAVLPEKHSAFKALAAKLAEFSGALGGVAEVASLLSGVPVPSKLVEEAAKTFASKPKDVPALKAGISALLSAEKKRILVVIDDIDRLAPDEVRQLFTVIKALADFPYVTYLLAFDRELAGSAIERQTGLPGERFLEKIVQVPFELPMADAEMLQQALFAQLELVVSGTATVRVNSAYWAELFHGGLDVLFTVPRDIVRLTNALKVTYPAVKGEVNPVDFIAIECIRLFVPTLYAAVRSNPDAFSGYELEHENTSEEGQRTVAFHEKWLEKVPEQSRSSVRRVVVSLFPKVDALWRGTNYSAQELQSWRAELRICAPEVFPAYFRLSLLPGAVTRADIDAMLAATMNAEAFGAFLRQASHVRNSKGISKARGLLGRFMDHIEEVPSAATEHVITALFQVGDELLLKSDQTPGMFAEANDVKVRRACYHMLKKIPSEERYSLIVNALSSSSSLHCAQRLLGTLSQESDEKDDALLPKEQMNNLKSTWCARAAQLSAQPDFISRPAISDVLLAWSHWGTNDDAKRWWTAASESHEGLLKLVSATAQESQTFVAGEVAVRIKLRVNPQWVEPFADVYVVADRLQRLLDSDSVPSQYEPAAKGFVLSCARMKAGRNPDALDFFDDDD